MSTHEMALRQICSKSFLRLKLILMGKPYIYSSAIRVSILVCYYYSYCREGNNDCATRTIEKFNVGTSRRLLRRQSTCHSSFNSIQAGSECDKA
jgi:hypothetical protein